MFFYSFQINALKTYVVENKLERRSAQWVPIADSEVSFPQLMGEQLRSITFGVYQLKLSSHIQEYMYGESRICVHKDDNNLIRVRIQSRHVSSNFFSNGSSIQKHKSYLGTAHVVQVPAL